jgi:CheY-like chemotaxis protein
VKHDAKILLVEDTEDDAFFFRRALKKTGIKCEFVQAWNGESAIAMLKAIQGQYPLIFLDLKMPHMDGYEVLEWVQKQTFKSKLHIIVLSGSGTAKDAAKARRLGASDYVVKPISADLLANTIAAWCKERNKGDEPKNG